MTLAIEISADPLDRQHTVEGRTLPGWLLFISRRPVKLAATYANYCVSVLAPLRTPVRLGSTPPQPAAIISQDARRAGFFIGI